VTGEVAPRAVAYVRLSQQSDRSIQRQREEVHTYAATQGYVLDEADVYDDGEGASGFDDDRREFAELVARLQEGDVGAVIVPNLSRLSRDRRTRLRLLLDLDDAGVELHSIERGHIDLEAAYALAIEAMKAESDDRGKREEIERAKRETRRRVENPEIDHGRPPLGFRFDEAGERWVPNPEEFENALRAVTLLDRGSSLREVSRGTGIPKSTVARIRDRRERYLAEAERLGIQYPLI
jgi:DNA invertase Pin-like site-specific DNA recombinase